jgi:hypothetical protein
MAGLDAAIHVVPQVFWGDPRKRQALGLLIDIIRATKIPVVAFSVGEEELGGIDTKPVMIGEIPANGQFQIVYTSKLLPPKNWSP